jgi:hypothetical protein
VSRNLGAIRPATASWVRPNVPAPEGSQIDVASPGYARRLTVAALGLGILGLVGVAWFDFGPSLPFADDFVYAWSVQKLVTSHRLVLFPEDSVLPFFQVVWASLVSLGHTDSRLLRLTLLPMLLLGAAMAALSARALGANRFWTVVASGCLLCQPLVLSVSTSFMTDTTFMALLMTAFYCAIGWIREGKRIPATIAFALLATLQHQAGAVFALALAVGLVHARRGRAVGRREWIALAALCVTLAGAVLIPMAAGASNAVVSARLTQSPLAVRAGSALQNAAFVLPTLGFFLVPFLAAMAQQRRPSRASLYIGLVLLVAPWMMVALVFRRLSVFPTDYLTFEGLGPVLVASSSHKPWVFPPWILLPVMAAGGLTSAAILTRQLPAWLRQGVSSIDLVAVILAAALLLPQFIVGTIAERYFIPSAAVLVPVLAARASRLRQDRVALGWAIASLAAGLVMYAVGEQDYQSWQAARYAAAVRLYRDHDPSTVDAGYEMNGVYWLLPLYDKTGQLPPRSPVNNLSGSFAGPAGAQYKLLIGPPRPGAGVQYQSVAPGSISLLRKPGG